MKQNPRTSNKMPDLMSHLKTSLTNGQRSPMKAVRSVCMSCILSDHSLQVYHCCHSAALDGRASRSVEAQLQLRLS